MEVANRGGVVIRILPHITAFVPLSQIDPTRVPLAEPARPGSEAPLSVLVGQPMRARILDLDLVKGTVVCSEKAHVVAEELSTLRVGSVCSGVVKKVTDYGAFVEVESADGKAHGVEGLVHVSELGWQRVRHPSDVVTPGQRIVVKIVSLDVAAGRVGLSLRAMEADPLLETVRAAARDGSDFF